MANIRYLINTNNTNSDIFKDYATKLAAIAPSNLYGYWPMQDSNSTIVDLSGNGYNGAYNGTVIRQSSGWSNNQKSVLYDGSTGVANVYSTTFKNNFSPAEMSISMWIKTDTSFWNSITSRYLCNFQVDANNYLSFYHYGNAPGTNGLVAINYKAGGTLKAFQWEIATTSGHGPLTRTGWDNWGFSLSASNNRIRGFLNGYQYDLDATGLGTWSGGNLTSTKALFCGFNVGSSQLSFNGNMAHVAIWNKELTYDNWNDVANASRYPLKGLLFIGDSKQSTARSWHFRLLDLINTAPANVYCLKPNRIGISGITIEGMYARVDSDISAMAGYADPVAICINLGVNNVGTYPNANFVPYYEYIINAYHTRFPTSKIYCARVWRQGYDSNCDSYDNIYLPQIVSDLPFVQYGPDERIVLKGSDNGATNTYDGIHPSAAGESDMAAGWKVSLGL